MSGSDMAAGSKQLLEHLNFTGFQVTRLAAYSSLMLHHLQPCNQHTTFQ